MKFLLYTATFILICIASLILFPSLINWNTQYGANIVKQLEKNYSGSKVRIGGNITGAFILPKITVNNLYIEYVDESSIDKKVDLIAIDKLDLYPSFLSLITFSPSINKVALYSPKITLNNLLKIISSEGVDIKNINIINGILSLESDKTSSNNKLITIKDSNIKISGKKKEIEGMFQIGQNDYKLTSEINNKNQDNLNFTANLSSKTADININWIKDLNKFQGSTTIKGDDLSGFLNDFTQTNKTAIFSSITSQENFEISADLLFVNKELQIKNLLFNSHSIQGFGEITTQKNSHFYMGLKFPQIDIDKLTENQENKYFKKESDLLDCFNIMISKEFNSDIKISVDQIKYKNQISNNLTVDAKILDGSIMLNKITLQLPGDKNLLLVSGKVENNKVRSSFIGHVLAQGNDFDELIQWLFPLTISDNEKNIVNKFSFNTDLYIAPRIFSLSNIKIITKTGDIDGELHIKHRKRKNTAVGDLNINNIDFDRYILKTPAQKDDQTGQLPMQWLRNMEYTVMINTKINNFLMYKKKIDQFSFVTNIAKSRLGIDEVIFNSSDNSDLSGNLEISIDPQNIRPSISAFFKSNQYDIQLIKCPELQEKFVNPTSGTLDKIRWSTKQINFFNLDKFDGNIGIEIKKIKTKKSYLDDFKFQAELKDGLMSINKFSFIQEQGFVVMRGNLGMGALPSLSAILSVSNINFENVMENFFNIQNIKGNISMSGSIQTQGKSLFEWMNYLTGKIEYAATGIKVLGLNFNSFITNLFTSKNKSEIASLTQIGLYQGITFFETIDGKADINNGISSFSSQFKINRANGAIAANFSLSQFTLMSLFRFFFIPPGGSSPVSIDMNLQGPIWHPKITFNIDSLYGIVSSSKN